MTAGLEPAQLTRPTCCPEWNGEVALHTWDAGEALGRPAQIDPGVAQLVYDFYRYIPMDQLRANGVYGPEVLVPASAPLPARLLALLGRRP